MTQSPRRTTSPSPAPRGGSLGGGGTGTGGGGGRGVTFEPTTAPFQRTSHNNNSNNNYNSNSHHHNGTDNRHGSDTGMSSITTGGGGRGGGGGVPSSGVSSKRGTRHGEGSLVKLGSQGQGQGQGHPSTRLDPTSSQEVHPSNSNSGGGDKSRNGGGGGGGYQDAGSSNHSRYAPSGSKMKMLLARAACSEDIKVAQTAVKPRPCNHPPPPPLVPGIVNRICMCISTLLSCLPLSFCHV